MAVAAGICLLMRAQPSCRLLSSIKGDYFEARQALRSTGHLLENV